MFISGLYSSSPLCRRKTANLTSSLCPAVHQPFECSKWPSAEFNEMREMSLVSILWINCPDRGSSSHWSCLGWMFAGPVNEKSPLLILLLYWFSDKVGVLCQESHFLDDLAQSVHQPTTLVSTFLALTLIVDFFLFFSFFSSFYCLFNLFETKCLLPTCHTCKHLPSIDVDSPLAKLEIWQISRQRRKYHNA